jgi:hypothetical protein
LAAGGTATLRLDMDGPTIRVLVNGVQVISVQDVSVTAAGRGGVVIGGNINGLATLLSDTTGLQLDNFSVITGAAGAVDAKGSSTGTYLNGAARASAGALALDPNTSSLFDGVDDAMQVRTPAGLPTGAAGRSVELWLRTTSTSRQVLFDDGSEAGAGQEFGLWLDAGASTLTAWGYGASYDKTFTPPSTLADGAWHHVVETYDGAVVTVFVDGVGLPSQAVTLGTVLDSYGFTLGAVLNPGDAASAGGPFNGTLDDVSLYNVALAPATVTNHYQLGTAH